MHNPRSNNRSPSQCRPIKIITDFTNNPLASVLIEMGESRVLCTASVEYSVPNWLRNGARGHGWITAEYALIPGSTIERSRRERQNLSGRTHEIQRIISRALRASVDLKLLGEMTITIDCDVLQADGSTRATAINGAYIALRLAIDKLIKQNKIKLNPIIDAVAAISVGIFGEHIYVDLDYQEDMHADTKANIVMNANGQLLEVQSLAEKTAFTRQQLNKLLDVAIPAIKEIFEEQNTALV